MRKRYKQELNRLSLSPRLYESLSSSLLPSIHNRNRFFKAHHVTIRWYDDG